MELSHVGNHCHFKSCNRLDFLPFKCELCGEIFCEEHRQFEVHSCKNIEKKQDLNVVNLTECPICSKSIPVRVNTNIDEIMNVHIDSACKLINLAELEKKIGRNQPNIINTNNNNNNPQGGYRLGGGNDRKKHGCTYLNCKRTEFVRITCNKCHRVFCVKHRSPQTHDCEREKEQKERGETLVEQRKKRKAQEEKRSTYLQQSINKFALEQKNKKAIQVRNMRMKAHAKGNKNIDLKERFYLEAIYSIDSKVKPKLLFFRRTWSIGKVLDSIADMGNIENNNNKPNFDKLYLFHLKTGEILPTSAQLDQSPLLSGDSVLLATEKQAKQ